MNKDLQNKIIAEHIGVVYCDEWSHAFRGNYTKRETCGHQNCHPAAIPIKFTDSLDAIHLAEKTIIRIDDYLYFLREVTGPFPDAQAEWNDSWWERVVCATATQRAEAFIKYIKKWICDDCGENECDCAELCPFCGSRFDPDMRLCPKCQEHI